MPKENHIKSHKMTKKKFNWRSFISFGLFFSFIQIFISGIILYIAPPGRVAHWNNWEFLAFTKDDWQANHTLFSYTFAILAAFHIFKMNWRSICSYVKLKSQQHLNKKRELFFSFLLMIIIFFGTALHLPPFGSVMDLATTIENSWEKKTDSPPVPHTEKFSISEISDKYVNLSPKEIIEKLNNKNIKVESKDQTLEEIGTINDLPPSKIYEFILANEDVITKPVFQPGQGLGNRTLQEYADYKNKDVRVLLNHLEQNGIKAKPTQSFREISSNNNTNPRQVLNVVEEMKD